MPEIKNPRYERFACELAKGVCADEAYVAAGFKRNRGNATRLKANESISARVAEIVAAASERAGVTIECVLSELAKIGFANMADYMRAGVDGEPALDFSALTRDQSAALQEVTVEEFKDASGEESKRVRRMRFKLYDKRAALVDMGKHLGMFKERFEHTGKNGGPIETRELTPLELARRVAFILEKGRRQLEAE